MSSIAQVSGRLIGHALPAHLPFASRAQWDRLMLERLWARRAVTLRQYAHGACVFQAGEPFQLLYVVRSGAIKLCTRGGVEDVSGFRLPGEWLGIKSIGRTMLRFDAIALGDCMLWEFPYRAVLDLCAENADLHAGLTFACATQTRHDRLWSLPEPGEEPDARVAAFVRDVAARCGTAPDFLFAASSEDIASYLGVARERVEAALDGERIAGRLARESGGWRILGS